jgi:3D (Asp-Asp-Asp) domain-containing protein
MRWMAFLLFAGILLSGCSFRRLPDWEDPIPRAQYQKIRTTAYTHTESDHIKHSNRNALGTSLQCGAVNSAAADWSRWPAGTVFRVLATNEIFVVDDYGWALSGTNTIDLYKPTRSAMNQWGVRRVTIEILEWGDPARSRKILAPRRKHAHVRRMLKQIDKYH